MNIKIISPVEYSHEIIQINKYIKLKNLNNNWNEI